MCNIAADASHTTDPPELLGDLVPTSVAQLSLSSNRKVSYKEAIEALFRHFPSTHYSQLSALRELYISCHWNADILYQEQCDRVVKEASDKGVVVYLSSCGAEQRHLFDGEI